MGKPLPSLYTDHYIRTYSPDRALRAAVLERAVRDLKDYGNKNIRVTAIQWFLSKRKRHKNAFSFNQIKEDLNLGKMEIEFLLHLVAIAEEVENAC